MYSLISLKKICFTYIKKSILGVTINKNFTHMYRNFLSLKAIINWGFLVDLLSVEYILKYRFNRLLLKNHGIFGYVARSN